MGLIYPNVCHFCGRISKEEMCNECRKEIVYITEPRCKRCGRPVRSGEAEYCYDCAGKSVFFEQGKNLWIHKGRVKQSIYQFKYQNRRIYAKFYGTEMVRLYGDYIRSCEIDCIIPIPLHRKRRRKRGYNQTELIAREVGKYMGILVDQKAIMRCKYTDPQKELNPEERKKNLKNAFKVKKQIHGYRNVLLIDDIYTTGSTIDAVSEKLKKAGVQNVWFLTVSIGQGF